MFAAASGCDVGSRLMGFARIRMGRVFTRGELDGALVHLGAVGEAAGFKLL